MEAKKKPLHREISAYGCFDSELHTVPNQQKEVLKLTDQLSRCHIADKTGKLIPDMQTRPAMKIHLR
jgi:hypothetical protein